MKDETYVTLAGMASGVALVVIGACTGANGILTTAGVGFIGVGLGVPIGSQVAQKRVFEGKVQ